MSQDNLMKLKSASGTILYSRKNKKKLAGHKIELKKFDKKLRKRVTFKEVKK
ncbi:MAG: 50S ribosomal protein L33 [Candidatus Pacebacteria bacterium]|jgi:ribosomal protein L33|nr:50S ribosomal protein L33 [Candidatus Paceibacterota bacterium]